MTLGFDTTAQLPYLRSEAESRMTETVRFFTVAEGTNATGEVVDVETVIADDVKARVRNTTARESRDAEVAGQMPAVSQMRVDVPVGSVNVGASVFVRVLSSTVDPGLVGEMYRTQDSCPKGQVTAWRYPVEQA